MSRPTDDPAFATSTNYAAGPYSGQANKQRPPSGNINEGFDPGAGVPAEWINYLISNHGAWLKWLLTLPTTASDAPQFIAQDSSGNNRYLIDHNGYPIGRRTEIREDWLGQFTSISTSTNPLVNFPKWKFIAATTESLTISLPTTTYPSGFVDMATLASIGSVAQLSFSETQLRADAANISAVVECEVGLANIGGAISHADIAFGFNNNDGASPPYSANSVVLRYSGSGNWIATTGGGASQDTGVPPITGTEPNQRFRFEFHGSASPYGAKVRVFINESLVATLTTGLPASALFCPIFTLKNATGAINHMYIGSVYMTWNRQLSAPSL